MREFVATLSALPGVDEAKVQTAIGGGVVQPAEEVLSPGVSTKTTAGD